MKTETAFWDTSAIIPLFCSQVTSAETRQIRRKFKQAVVWWGTHVEVHSSINRLLREKVLSQKQSKKSFEKWEALRALSFVVRPDESVLATAAFLTAGNGLRALDAFQLAAALVWCGEKPRNRPFICADNRLSEAAAAAGFDVVPIV